MGGVVSEPLLVSAKAESFMKTLKVGGVYPMEFETFSDVVEHLPRFIDQIYNGEGSIQPSVISSVHFEDQHARLMVTEAT